MLGREDIEARLARYIDAHERTVGTLARRIEYVDLRYPNGFAVRIPELKNEPPLAAPRGKRKGAATEKSAERRISAQLRPKRSEGAADSTERREALKGAVAPEGAA